MATQKLIKTIIKFRRGQSDEWTEVNPILRDGEPGFELDTFRLKIGDGATAWNDLKYIGSEESEIFPVLIEDPTDGQVLLYDGESGKWRNYQFVDAESIIFLDSDGLSLKGYKDARQGQMLVKDETEGLAWINPVSDQSLQEAVTAASESASRAGTSAVQAGNFAGEAIQAAAQVERKFWYGTMDEYNNLETINRSTIYVILHE